MSVPINSGRFLETDPAGYADSMNLYAYVGNNPLNATDPTGAESALRNLHYSTNAPLPPGLSPEGGSGPWTGDGLHTSLDAAGLTPGVGIVPDALNAVIYAAQGDAVNAGISAAAMLPAVGQAAGLSRLAGKAGNAAFDALTDGARMSTDDALSAASNVLGDSYDEIKPGIFRSSDEAGNALQVRMTDSDLQSANNHAGAPHMNFESGTVTTAPGRSTASFTHQENKHIFLDDAP